MCKKDLATKMCITSTPIQIYLHIGLLLHGKKWYMFDLMTSCFLYCILLVSLHFQCTQLLSPIGLQETNQNIAHCHIWNMGQSHLWHYIQVACTLFGHGLHSNQYNHVLFPSDHCNKLEHCQLLHHMSPGQNLRATELILV